MKIIVGRVSCRGLQCKRMEREILATEDGLIPRSPFAVCRGRTTVLHQKGPTSLQHIPTASIESHFASHRKSMALVTDFTTASLFGRHRFTFGKRKLFCRNVDLTA